MKEEKDTETVVKYENLSLRKKAGNEHEQEEDEEVFPHDVHIDMSVSSQQWRRRKHPSDSQYSSMCSDEDGAMRHESVSSGGGEDCLFSALYDNVHLKHHPIGKEDDRAGEGAVGDVARCSIIEEELSLRSFPSSRSLTISQV